MSDDPFMDIMEAQADLEKIVERTRLKETPGAFTSGSVLFADPSGNIAQDNINLFWDDTNNTLHLGGTSTITGTPRLALKGTNADGAAGPHFATYTAADIYPILHFLSFTHDNMEMSFDAYYNPGDGQWKSSDAGSNFQIRKNGDQWGVWYDSGVAQGSTVTWNEGVRLGITGIFSSLGDMRAYGDFISSKAGVDRTGYIFHPLTTYLTSTSFDGDAFSDTAKTLIDLSAVFGAPADITAVLFSVGVRDSGSAATDTALILSDDNTAGSGVSVSPMPVNDRLFRGELVVPCDANGDVYYQIDASGASTFDVFLSIIGYWI